MDETFDFIVIGSGGGSMCAGLVLREAAKTVLILEKTRYVGGTTARSGGVMWIPNNPIMKKAGIPDSPEQANLYLDSVVGDHNDAPGATRQRRRTYVERAPEMVDYLLGQGLKLTRITEYPDYYDEAPGGSVPGRTVVAELFNANELGPWREKLRPNFLQVAASLEEGRTIQRFKKAWVARKAFLKVAVRTALSKLTGARWVTAGAALQGRMLKAALGAGVDIRTESGVTEILVEDGRVTGVVTTKDGKPWRVGARLGVLVNAGGFARNQAMRDEYLPGTSTNWTATAEGDTGEMILELKRHGAAIGQMDTIVGLPLSLPPGYAGGDLNTIYNGVQGATLSPHAILVDQTGVRYMNEAGSYMAYTRNLLERNKTVPALPSWAIVDSQFMRKYGLLRTAAGAAKPERWYSEGFLHKGETVEDLAKDLAIDPAVLKATVERYNGFVAKGYDEDFKRGARAYDRWLGDFYNQPNPCLGTISEGPFYAFPVLPGDVGTYGGVVTDERARVLREDGSWIGGLYATGVTTASVMGFAYPGAGSSVGPSFVWGYVAARDAVEAGQSAQGVAAGAKG